MFEALVTMTPGRVGKPCECTIREKTGNVLAHLLFLPFAFDVRGTLEKASHLQKSLWQFTWYDVAPHGVPPWHFPHIRRVKHHRRISTCSGG